MNQKIVLALLVRWSTCQPLAVAGDDDNVVTSFTVCREPGKAYMPIPLSAMPQPWGECCAASQVTSTAPLQISPLGLNVASRFGSLRGGAGLPICYSNFLNLALLVLFTATD